jgi:hypothetical protein
MQCLFPGPSFAFCIASMVSSLFACALFALKWREALLVRRMALEHLHGRQLLGHAVDLRTSISPIFGDNVLASPTHAGSARSMGSRSGSTGTPQAIPAASGAASALLRSPDSMATQVPGRFLYERHYSLYGAFLRRFATASMGWRCLPRMPAS